MTFIYIIIIFVICFVIAIAWGALKHKINSNPKLPNFKNENYVSRVQDTPNFITQQNIESKLHRFRIMSQEEFKSESINALHQLWIQNESLKILSKKISNISIYPTSYTNIEMYSKNIESACYTMDKIDNKTRNFFEECLLAKINKDLKMIHKESDYLVFIWNLLLIFYLCIE